MQNYSKCFNPRSPRGGATLRHGQRAPHRQFQSTLPARGSDQGQPGQVQDFVVFQSTLPARGSDASQRFPVQMGVFQSTLPARGSDSLSSPTDSRQSGFNPRSPRGGATSFEVSASSKSSVSIHAPREGERLGINFCRYIDCAFQSTLPARGSDIISGPSATSCKCFNPRSPRGGATTRL